MKDNPTVWQIQALLLAALCTLLAACSGNATDPNTDSSPPEAVIDLTAFAVGGDTVRLTWSSTGDDGVTGKAAAYDVRYHGTTLAESTWEVAAHAFDPPTPLETGSAETFLISGLGRGTWSFALKVADEVPNWSTLSNVVQVAVGDSIPPAAVTDLFAAVLDQDTIEVDWTATGDDSLGGSSEEYDLRYALETITSQTWAAATSVPIVAPPEPAGDRESFRLSLPFGSVYYFALRVRDNGENWSGLSNIASLFTSVLDETAPAQVSDLTVEHSTGRTLTLVWTAPGDDDVSGQASSYDLRYSQEKITETSWSTSTPFPRNPDPARAGSRERTTLRGLDPRSVYHVALRTADEVSIWSQISNVVTSETGSTWSLLGELGNELSYASPSWSPDGTRLAVAATRDNNQQIFIASADGKSLVQLTANASAPRSPEWSPRGDEIAYIDVENDLFSIWKIGLEKGAIPVLLVAGDKTGLQSLTWSPDGTQIAYQTPTRVVDGIYPNIRVVSSDGEGPVVLIPNGGNWGNLDPAWSPDGRYIALSSNRESSDYALWVVEIATEKSRLLVAPPFRNFNGDPAWSPDGEELIYILNRQGVSNLWRISASGGAPKQITFDPTSNRHPTWSPSGNRVAYTHYDTGRREVWLQILD